MYKAFQSEEILDWNRCFAAVSLLAGRYMCLAPNTQQYTSTIDSGVPDTDSALYYSRPYPRKHLASKTETNSCPKKQVVSIDTTAIQTCLAETCV